MASDSKIKATVFIPTWFGERYLEEMLTSVFSQKVDFEYEVLIYDTSSTDRTPEIIADFARRYKNIKYLIITKQEFGHGKTRQRAAQEAKGEYIVYLTQDATPAHDRWLYEILKPFDISPNIVGVMGKQIPRAHCIPMLKSEIKAVFSGFGPDFGTTIFYDDDFIKDQGTYDAVSFYSDANSAARTSFLKKDVPYQNVNYAEDQLFGRDIINGGYMKVYAPRASVIHSNDLLLGEYSRRMFDETYGLRNIGIPVQEPSFKAIIKMIVRGILRDTKNILVDRDYSPARKMYWLVINPLFHVQKWRGVKHAFKVELGKTNASSKYSLESTKH